MPTLRRSSLITLTLLAAVFMPPAIAQGRSPSPSVGPQVVPLWPDGSANNPPDGPRPTLEIYRTFAPARSAGATIVILPGGGYSLLSPFEKLFAEYLRSIGYDAVVVNYRVKPNRYPAPLADALRALRLVRHNGRAWGLPVDRIALLGGSAGGHLAALTATRPDFYRDPADDLAATVSARPDRLILFYPVISSVAPYRHGSFHRWFPPDATEQMRFDASPEKHVTKDNPPTIIFLAADDNVVTPENSFDFVRAYRAAGVPVELHLFSHGGHGYRFAYDVDNSPRWRAILQEWLAAWIDRKS